MTIRQKAALLAASLAVATVEAWVQGARPGPRFPEWAVINAILLGSAATILALFLDDDSTPTL